MIGRLPHLLACLFFLSGCNLVGSSTPVLTDADRSIDQPRPGLWALEEPHCSFRAANPITAWPRCATPLIARPGEWVAWSTDPPSPGWASFPFVVTGSNPQVMQIRFLNDDPSTEGPDYGYHFAGLVPLAHDADGQVVRYSAALLQCGDSPPSGAKLRDGSPRYGTVVPYPGVTMSPGEWDCTPSGREGLLQAAAANQVGSGGNGFNLRWIRDTYP